MKGSREGELNLDDLDVFLVLGYVSDFRHGGVEVVDRGAAVEVG